ncbi:DUF3576 domain-containing protein [Pelagibacteraceae bacterium]|nr:DUF3576 domain-containing protein [Pelagibacteraceae bacterium]
MFLTRYILFFVLFFVLSCNSNKSEEEMEELWSKAQTKHEIIERSGTKFNSATDMDLAMRDAETRLQTGGGLFGKGGMSIDGLFGNKKKDSGSTTKVAMSVNPFLWRAAIETINFMPLSSADQIGGIIITDWYSTSNNESERCKLNIFITGTQLNAENLKVTSFCQNFKDPLWINKEVDQQNNIKIENAILNKAKKLKLQLS